MIYDQDEAEYAEKLACTFIKAMNDKKIKHEIAMTACALSFIKTCRAMNMKDMMFDKMCDYMKDAYLESLLDD